MLTLYHQVTPWMLLLFTFILGLGAVMNDPAWQAITPEVVRPENHAPAVALNSVGFNVARAFGPALGGLVIAAAGSGVAFLLNAASFFGVIFFLYRWKRPHVEQVATGRVRDALVAGSALCSRRSASAIHPDPDGRVQPGRQFPARAAAHPGPSSWRDRIRTAAGIFWPGSPGRRRRSAAGAHALLRKSTGGFRHPALCRHDLCRRTSANIFPALSGIVCQRHGVDRNPGLFEYRGADHVSLLPAGTGAVDVSAGPAGWHGVGQHGVGGVGHSGRSPDRSAMFGGGDGRGPAGGPPASSNVAAVGINAVRLFEISLEWPRGDSRPRLSRRAQLNTLFWERPCSGASLRRTAEGSCPHAVRCW